MRSILAHILAAPRAVLAAMVAIVIAGTYSYLTIPKEANPNIDVPVFYVSIPQPGISPEDAERLLVRPMENRLRGLSGLKEITAIASEGHAGIVLEFTIDFDKDRALADVRAKVDQARGELPQAAEAPTVTETNFALVPTMMVTLSGDVPERTLFRHARRLQDAIEGIPSVLEARLTGTREELVEVVIDQKKLESYGLTQAEVITAVDRNNRLVPAGFLDTGAGRFNVKVPGLFRTAEDVMRLPLKTSGDGVVTLGDIAEVRRTFKDATTFLRIDGQPAMGIEVVKRLGQNVVETNAAIREVVNRETRDWPQAIRVNQLLDQSTSIFEMLDSLQASILTAILLVMVVVLYSLSVRSVLFIGISIPTSFVMGFLFLSIAGYTVNIMVLFGLVLTVGIVVDAAIVMVEYADRRIAEGLDRKAAYAKAAQQMFWPIMSSTATTLAAFLPMLLWPGVAGEFMSYLPIMVIVTLTASFITAMVFIPVIGSLFGPKTVPVAQREAALALSGNGKLDLRSIRGATGAYARTIALAVRHPAKVLVLLAGIVAACIVAYAQNPTGIQFFVEEEPEQAIVLVSTRGNLSAAEQRDLVGEVERELMQIRGIKHTVTRSGKAPGAPSVTDVRDTPNDMIGQITIELDDYRSRRSFRAIETEIRDRTGRLPGLRVEVRKVEGGPPSGKAIRLEIAGESYADVTAATARISAHMETMTGLIDIEDTRPLPGIEWQIRVDREQAARFGADVAQLGTMVQLVTNGVLVGKFRPDDAEDEIDIRVRLPEDQRSLDVLDQLSIRTPVGLVPIANMVERTAQQQVSTITRTNGRFTMMAKANVGAGVSADTRIRELQAWLDGQTWAGDVKFRFRGTDEDQKESGAFLAKAMVASLFIMLMILVAQYNSFYQTALTLSTVVLSVVGVLLGMAVTGQPFSVIMTGTGILALAGVVVANAIILIDTYNEKRREGAAPDTAAIATAAERLRPVMLTTVTTIVGLVPTALQWNFDFFTREIVVGGITSVWWVQLSTAIIFGLTFATILTLVLVPVMLAAPAVWRRGLERRGWIRRRDEAAPGVPPPASAIPIRHAAE